MQTADEREQLESFLDSYRVSLPRALDRLDEEQVRRRLVPSKTTLLGLIKHITYVEAFWFQHATTGTPLKDLGVASSPDRSFTLERGDSVGSLLEAHTRTVESSRAAVSDLSLEEVVAGRGHPVNIRFVFLQCVKEYAQHSGHADILREQILAS